MAVILFYKPCVVFLYYLHIYSYYAPNELDMGGGLLYSLTSFLSHGVVREFWRFNRERVASNNLIGLQER